MPNNNTHEWHLATGFCIHCGLDVKVFLTNKQKCHRHKNVTAISHRIRKYNVLRTPTKNNDSNSK